MTLREALKTGYAICPKCKKGVLLPFNEQDGMMWFCGGEKRTKWKCSRNGYGLGIMNGCSYEVE